MSGRLRSHPAGRSKGLAALELALLVAMVLGMVDLGRWLAAAGSLHEAARMGARLAVVCDLDDPQVNSRALARVVGLHALAQPPTLTVAREPAAVVELPRESLSSQLQGRNNPSCL